MTQNRGSEANWYLVAVYSIDIELIEQGERKVIHAYVEYDLNNSIKNTNKYKKDDEKIVRDKESEEELANLYYGKNCWRYYHDLGFLLAEKRYFSELLDQIDEVRRWFYFILYMCLNNRIILG